MNLLCRRRHHGRHLRAEFAQPAGEIGRLVGRDGAGHPQNDRSARQRLVHAAQKTSGSVRQQARSISPPRHAGIRAGRAVPADGRLTSRRVCRPAWRRWPAARSRRAEAGLVRPAAGRVAVPARRAGPAAPASVSSPRGVPSRMCSYLVRCSGVSSAAMSVSMRSRIPRTACIDWRRSLSSSSMLRFTMGWMRVLLLGRELQLLGDLFDLPGDPHVGRRRRARALRRAPRDRPPARR